MEAPVKREGHQEVQPREMTFSQKAEEKFGIVFKKILGENAPTISISMFYSPHRTPQDFNGLSESIAQNNVALYIPEAAEWTNKHLTLLRQASFGELDSEALDKQLNKYPSGFSANVREVFDSHKPVIILDIPRNHDLVRKYGEVWVYSPSYESGFVDVLEYTREFLYNIAAYVDAREEYMISQITVKRVKELLDTNPEYFENKKEINILLSLGLSHARMPYDYPESSLTDQGVSMSRSDMEIDDNLAADIFLESFFEPLFSVESEIAANRYDITDRLTKDSRKISMFKRKLLSQFSYEDAERIFEYRKELGIFPRREFERIFEEKGLNIPHSEQELDEFLASD
jgi:hypothetical protein